MPILCILGAIQKVCHTFWTKFNPHPLCHKLSHMSDPHIKKCHKPQPLLDSMHLTDFCTRISITTHISLFMFVFMYSCMHVNQQWCSMAGEWRQDWWQNCVNPCITRDISERFVAILSAIQIKKFHRRDITQCNTPPTFVTPHVTPCAFRRDIFFEWPLNLIADFTGQMTQPTVSQHWRTKTVVQTRLQSHQDHTTMLQ